MTTIKVSSTTRDRLKAQAAHAHRSLGAYLDDLADLADRQARFAALKHAVASTSPADLDRHSAEVEAWIALDPSDV